jgi:hypothetical protein
MLIESCILTVATEEIKKINSLEYNELISSLFLELTVSISLSEAYYKIHNSIYWKTANKATKNRVEATCQDWVVKILNHTHEAKKLFNSYCDEQEKIGGKINHEVFESLSKFRYKFESFERVLNSQHLEEINPTQLKLI